MVQQRLAVVGPYAWTAARAAGLLAVASLLTCWFLQPVPPALKWLAALAVAASVARPSAGLLIFAALAPVSTALASLCGAPGMGAQLLEQMALGVGAGALLRRGTPGAATRIGAPALFMAVVVLTSAVAMVPTAAAPVARHLTDAALLGQLLDRQAAESSPVWAPLLAALVVAECALLAWAAERTVRRTPRLAVQLVLAGLIGQAAAASLNLKAVVDLALRTDEGLAALPRMFVAARVSMQTDWNAGASLLLLGWVAGFGLLRESPVRRGVVPVLLGIVALGLWTTGSRIALAMAACAVVAAVTWRVAHAGRRHLVVATAALLVVAAGAWMVTSSSARNAPLPMSVTLRLEMAKAGARMFEQAPLFGIGIARFFDASEPLAGPYLLSVGWRPRENAHNNFVQVLAELGLVGFGALLWWLATPLLAAARAQASNPSPLRAALMLAVVATVGTWLTGHPLLVPEFAFVFWAYGGVLAALTPARPLAGPDWRAATLAAIVIVSVLPRAVALRNAADLEHLGIGLSGLWQHDDARQYREAGGRFTLFLPAGGRPVEVPVRKVPDAEGPLLIDVAVRGRVVDRVEVGGDGWQPVLVVVPSGPRRFEAVDFVVHPVGSSSVVPGVLLRVGKAVGR